MSRSVKLLGTFLACSGTLLLGTSHAATLLVDRRGQTPGAFASLAQVAVAVRPGDTVELVPGSGPYRETLFISRLGTAEQPIIIEGNGELVTGFDPFQFSFNAASARWEYTLPAPIGNQLGGQTNSFRHLIAYQGQRLLVSRRDGGFTSDFATLSADGLTLILGNASPSAGWEIGVRSLVVRISGSSTDPAAVPWHHVYRNLRASGARNDGFNIHGTGTHLRFENIEAFHNFDEGFSAHDSIHCAIDGGEFWGNDNGLYNQSTALVAIEANNIRAYANLGAGISMRQGASSLTNSRAWDNGISNMALGGTFTSRSNFTYQNRWPQPPFVSYQETQGQALGQEYPYAYDPFHRGQAPTVLRQAYDITGDEPTVLPLTRLPPFALAYADWRYIHFTAGQIADPSTSGESADPDGDGRDNRQEYLDGTHPLLVDRVDVIVGVEVPDASAASASGDPGLIVLRRSGSTESGLAVYFNMGGSAINGSDYAALDNYVEIPAGASSAPVPVQPLQAGANGEPSGEGAGGLKLAVLSLVEDLTYLIGAATGTVSIDDPDLPIVTLSAPDASASETPGEDGLFRFRRSGSTAAALTVNFTVAGTATPDEDYPGFGSSIEFPIGVDTLDLTVVATQDGLSETNETVALTLAKAPAYRVANAIGSVTIEGSPLATITLVASDALANERPGDPRDTGRFTVTRSSGSAALTVRFRLAGTATAGVDYAAVGSSVLIPAGAASADIEIVPVDDGLAESSESVVATLLIDGSYVLGTPRTATVSIANYTPATVSVATTDPSASETPGNTGLFSISRTGPQSVALTVQYVISGSATPDLDYTAVSGTLVIPANSSAATVGIAPLPDNLVEGSETVVLSIAPGADYALGTNTTGTVNIADTVPPTVTLVVNDSAASEAGVNTGLFTIRRTGPQTAPLTVEFALSGTATPGADYTDPGRSAVIPAGASAVTVTITPLADTLTEGSESAVLSLVSQPHYALGTTSAGTVNIADVAAPTLSLNVSDATASEVDGDTGSFVISRSGGTGTALTVNVVLDGSAVSGADFAPLAGSYTIAAGFNSVTITVAPVADSQFEEPETVVLSLGAGSGYLIGSPASGSVTIFDAAPPTLWLMVTAAAASEAPGNSGEFSVGRSGPTTSPLTVQLAVGGSATPGVDYAELPAAVEIPAGAGSVLIAVLPVADTLAEVTETVVLTLVGDPAYVLYSSNSGTVNIANVVAPTISVVTNDPSASEAPGNGGLITIRRTGSSISPLSVPFTLGGSATPGVDYTDLISPVVIPAGSNAITFPVSPLPDALIEGPESVLLSVDADSRYVLGSSTTATVNIADTPVPTVSLVTNDNVASEAADSSGLWTVMRSGPRTGELTVRYALDGSATPGVDYSILSGTVLIPVGAGSATVTLAPLADELLEDAETAVLSILEDPAYLLGTTTTGTVNIADVPPPP